MIIIKRIFVLHRLRAYGFSLLCNGMEAGVMPLLSTIEMTHKSNRSEWIWKFVDVVALRCACQTIISGFKRESVWFLLLRRVCNIIAYGMHSSQRVMHPSCLDGLLLLLSFVTATPRQLNSIPSDVIGMVKQLKHYNQ